MREGILQVYSKREISKKGEPPIYDKVLKGEYFYTECTVGIKRHFAAMQLDKKISKVVRFILDDVEIDPDADFIMIDKKHYSVLQLQIKEDESGEMYQYATLERVD